MKACQLVILLLGTFSLPCLGRPGYSSPYYTGAVNPYYSTVGGSSIVNVFPAGYAYQTVLDDGSISQVVFLRGPETQQYLQHLLRSTLPTSPTGFGAPSVGVSYKQSASAPAFASGPSAPSAPETSPEETATSSIATEAALPVPTEAIPPQSNSLFNFPTFPTLRSFPVTSYIANPFNSLMSYLGLPQFELNGGASPVPNNNNNNNALQAGNEDAQNNNDAEASNISPISTRISTDNSRIEAVTTAAPVPESTATSTTTEAATEAAVTLAAPQSDSPTPASPVESQEQTTVAQTTAAQTTVTAATEVAVTEAVETISSSTSAEQAENTTVESSTPAP